MDILRAQQALKAGGFNPGPLDGVWGRISIGALKGFQAKRGLPVDGVLGPTTLAALGLSDKVLSVPPVWFEDAKRFLGLKETPGTASNPTIMEWAKAAGAKVASLYTSDAVAWCGLFVESRIAATLPGEPLPDKPLWALDWLNFGVPLTEGALGAVCVFKRQGGGHVAFYAGEDKAAGTLRVLGGNQSDAVTYANITRSRLAGMRWPASVPRPTGGAVQVTATGGLSTNEA